MSSATAYLLTTCMSAAGDRSRASPCTSGHASARVEYTAHDTMLSLSSAFTSSTIDCLPKSRPRLFIGLMRLNFGVRGSVVRRPPVCTACTAMAITARAAITPTIATMVRKPRACRNGMVDMPPRSRSPERASVLPIVSSRNCHSGGPAIVIVSVEPRRKAAVVSSGLLAIWPLLRASPSFLSEAASVFSPESESAMDQRPPAGAGASCTARAKVSRVVA